MKQWLTGLAVTATAAGLVGLVGPVGSAGAVSTSQSTSGSTAESASCATNWGSLEKRAVSRGASRSTSLTNVRAGRHDCFDRMVLNFAGTGEARVRYVRAVPYQARSGYIPLRGGAFLEILTGPSYNVNTGAGTYTPANRRDLVNVAGWRTFRQTAHGGSYEGQTTIGLGVRARLPFRLVSLSGPGNGSRIAIDVANSW